MKGKLYGIGVGPGDPELLTIKAVNTINKCSVIAVPKTGKGERTAFSIVEQYLGGKELLECRFAMDRDMAKRKEARQAAANEIVQFLEAGKDVGYITLGDPTTYSTYMYVHEIIVALGFKAEVIPGITSFAGAAAAFGTALCEDDEVLTIIPGRHHGTISELLDCPGNKVIMKSGESLSHVIRELKERGYADRTKIACRVSLDGQRLYESIEAYEAGISGENVTNAGYFTLVIVKEQPPTT